MNIMRLTASRRTRLVIAIVAVILLATAGILSWWVYSKNQPQQQKVQADQALVSSGTEALASDDADKLRDNAEQIKQIDGYEQVPEYVYIVARAEAQNGNSNEVARLLDIFRGFGKDTEYSGQLEHTSHQDMESQLEIELESAKAVEKSNQDSNKSPGGGAAGFPEESGN